MGTSSPLSPPPPTPADQLTEEQIAGGGNTGGDSGVRGPRRGPWLGKHLGGHWGVGEHWGEEGLDHGGSLG